jgi:hypothetical protein
LKTAEIVNKILDMPYGLGQMAMQRMDCLSLLITFYGNKMPKEWRGWTKDNYARRWLKGEGREEFAEFLDTAGIPIRAPYMTDDDLVILDTPEGVTPAIYLGSGNLLVVTIESGAFVMPMHALNCPIKGVRRLG